MSAAFKIVHFSDPHLAMPLHALSACFDKRVIGRCNSIFRRGKSFRRELLPLAMEKILAEKPDLIVFTGDAATCSQPSEFELAAKIMKPLFRSGIPVLYTPGNHDCYVRNKSCRAALAEFRKNFANAPGPSAFETGPFRFLIFDSALPTNPVMSSGKFAKESQAFLLKECAEKKGPLVAVTHFPFAGTDRGLSALRRKLYHAGTALEMLQTGKLDLVLCGHIHVPYRKEFPGGGIEECSGSVTKAAVFQVIEYNPETGFAFREVKLC